MTTIEIRKQTYELGKFCSRHLIVVGRFIKTYIDNTEFTGSEWKELAETIKFNLVPDISDELVDLSVNRGVYLEPDEYQIIYTACLKELKKHGMFEDLEIDDIPSIPENKESEISKLKERLKELGE
jgi:hypothetical protein